MKMKKTIFLILTLELKLYENIANSTTLILN